MNTTRHLACLFCVLAVCQAPALAADGVRIQGSVKSFTDYVRIHAMPSRGAFFRKAPVTDLRSESTTVVSLRTGDVMGTNASIKALLERARALAAKGITTNQREFHVAFRTIEVAYMGEKVSLEYAGESHAANYRGYEQGWLALYAGVYEFVTRDLAPCRATGPFAINHLPGAPGRAAFFARRGNNRGRRPVSQGVRTARPH